MSTRQTRTAKVVLCVTVLMASCAVMAAEDAPSLSTSVSAAFMSKYIWRGQLLNDDYVMQPSVGVSYGGLSASWWGNVDMTDYHKLTDGSDNRYGHSDKWEFTEHDWTISYANTIPCVDYLKYSVGVAYYYYPSYTDDADTVEAFGSLGLDMILNPTVTLYRDIDEVDGTYVMFGVSHSVEKLFELSSDMPVGMTASASVGWGSEGYNRYYWGEDSSSMQDLSMIVGFPVAVMGWTVTPSVSYVTLMDSDIRETDAYSTNCDNNDSDYVFTGFTVSRSF